MLRQTFPSKMWVALVEVYISQRNDNKISHFSFQKSLNFEGPNKYFMSGRVKHQYIHISLMFLVSTIGLTTLLPQPVYLHNKIVEVKHEM